MKKIIALACVATLSSAAFASAHTLAPQATHQIKASDATDISARKKMKRMKMKKSMMKPGMDASKMGGEPPSGSMPGQKKGM